MTNFSLSGVNRISGAPSGTPSLTGDASTPSSSVAWLDSSAYSDYLSLSTTLSAGISQPTSISDTEALFSEIGGEMSTLLSSISANSAFGSDLALLSALQKISDDYKDLENNYLDQNENQSNLTQDQTKYTSDTTKLNADNATIASDQADETTWKAMLSDPKQMANFAGVFGFTLSEATSFVNTQLSADATEISQTQADITAVNADMASLTLDEKTLTSKNSQLMTDESAIVKDIQTQMAVVKSSMDAGASKVHVDSNTLASFNLLLDNVTAISDSLFTPNVATSGPGENVSKSLDPINQAALALLSGISAIIASLSALGVSGPQNGGAPLVTGGVSIVA